MSRRPNLLKARHISFGSPNTEKGDLNVIFKFYKKNWRKNFKKITVNNALNDMLLTTLSGWY